MTKKNTKIDLESVLRKESNGKISSVIFLNNTVLGKVSMCFRFYYFFFKLAEIYLYFLCSILSAFLNDLQ